MKKTGYIAMVLGLHISYRPPIGTQIKGPMSLALPNGGLLILMADNLNNIYFLGQSKPIKGDDGQETVPNELTQAMLGQMIAVAGKVVRVAGHGGTATIAKKAKPEVLTMQGTGLNDLTHICELDGKQISAVIRKVGTRYQVFVIEGSKLAFYADQEVGPGNPPATLQSNLTLRDLGSTKIIDGAECVVARVGGEVHIRCLGSAC